jgi:hypothetical protein
MGGVEDEETFVSCKNTLAHTHMPQQLTHIRIHGLTCTFVFKKMKYGNKKITCFFLLV